MRTATVAASMERRAFTRWAALAAAAPASLAGITLGATAGAAGAQSAKDLATQDLAKAATTLTGLAIEDIDLVEQFAGALAAAIPPERLKALSDASRKPTAEFEAWSRSAEAKDVVEPVMSLWLTGMLQPGLGGAAQPRVVSYTGAAVWKALGSFTKPPGVCGGAVGYWSRPPER